MMLGFEFDELKNIIFTELFARLYNKLDNKNFLRLKCCKNFITTICNELLFKA